MTQIRNIIFILIIFQLCFLIIEATAQPDATIPTYHWAYSYIGRLRLRGYFDDLNPLQQPFSERQVVRELTGLQRKIREGTVKPTARDQWLIDFLVAEFLTDPVKSSESKKMMIRPGVWTDEQVRQAGDETKFYTRLRSQIGCSFGEKLYLYNGIVLDQSLLDDPGYPGEQWRGFAGYAEQAYVRFTNDDLRFTNLGVRLMIGRDFLKWGSGKTGNLLFSANAQPMDQVAIYLKYKGIQFTALAADLDRWTLSAPLARQYQVQSAERFLAAHRLSLNFKNRFYLGLSEALVYGGPHGNWELMYLNPMLYYHGELLNGGGSDGNGFLYLDFDAYPWQNWEFYGELLVDDFQLEKKIPGDLEPNEIGLILGMQTSDWFGLQGSLLRLEYVRVANRTYNTGIEWEKFLRFNRPIGYSLGNNFDRWNLVAQYWLNKGLQFGLELDYIRKGEGSIQDEWDTPWFNYSVAEGYDEPFPYGVVEKSATVALNLKYHFRVNTMVACQVRYRDSENWLHEIGKRDQNWSFAFNFHWNWNTHFNY